MLPHMPIDGSGRPIELSGSGSKRNVTDEKDEDESECESECLRTMVLHHGGVSAQEAFVEWKGNEGSASRLAFEPTHISIV